MPVTWLVLYAISPILLFKQGQVTGSGLEPEDKAQDSGKVKSFSSQGPGSDSLFSLRHSTHSWLPTKRLTPETSPTNLDNQTFVIRLS